MSSNTQDSIACPWCTDGTRTKTHLVGDGQPGTPTRMESQTIECPGCDGAEVIDAPVQ
jgi:hypothetical protein